MNCRITFYTRARETRNPYVFLTAAEEQEGIPEGLCTTVLANTWQNKGM